MRLPDRLHAHGHTVLVASKPLDPALRLEAPGGCATHICLFPGSYFKAKRPLRDPQVFRLARTPCASVRIRSSAKLAIRRCL